LDEFLRTYRERIGIIAAGIPESRLADKWGLCVLKLNTRPALAMMSQILKNEMGGGGEVLSFVADVNRAWPVESEAPEKVTELARTIWVEMRESLEVIQAAHKFARPPDDIQTLFVSCSNEFFETW
jgi:hypothetical protein